MFVLVFGLASSPSLVDAYASMVPSRSAPAQHAPRCDITMISHTSSSLTSKRRPRFLSCLRPCIMATSDARRPFPYACSTVLCVSIPHIRLVSMQGSKRHSSRLPWIPQRFLAIGRERLLIPRKETQVHLMTLCMFRRVAKDELGKVERRRVFTIKRATEYGCER